MTNFVNTESHQFYSFQLAYDNVKAIPPGERQALADWAKTTDGQYQFLWDSANTPPIVDSIPSAEQALATKGATAPELSTWAMMAIGFAALAFAGYWRTRQSVWIQR